MSDATQWLRVMGAVLDGLEIAAYTLDTDDRALHWNRTFLQLFPEHAEGLHVGEPYQENLRRFYGCRLQGEERASTERYIEEGLARNREQGQPYSFEHHGRTLHVSSLPLPGIGRIRLWRAEGSRFPDGARPHIPGDDGGRAVELEHVADGVMVTDAELRILAVNEPFVAMYGLAGRSDAVGARFEDVYGKAWGGGAGAERSRFEAGLSLLAEQLRFVGAPFELPLPSQRWARVMKQRSPDGRRFFVHADITTIKRQQQHLVEAERRARASELELHQKSRLLEATLERMEQGVMMVNAQRIVEVCNRRAVELLGLPAEMMAGRPSFESVLEYQWKNDEFARTPLDIQAFVRSGGILDTRQRYERRRPDGRWIEVQSVPLEGGGVLRTYTDITERKHNEERIQHVARHDGLTTLVNREVFLEHLAGAVESAERVREGFAVHFIDLDAFKPINDRHGHAVGDKVLALVASRMRAVARDGDIVGRMGGDEFAMLQFRVADADAALGLARRLLAAVTQPMEIEGATLKVGASIGIAICAEQGLQADALLRNADVAMYAAKAAGRDTVRVFARHEGPQLAPPR
jgi:diguanylate cyclase (GGDEF)-like protein/PAS domain S-box-containing protein